MSKEMHIFMLVSAWMMMSLVFSFVVWFSFFRTTEHGRIEHTVGSGNVFHDLGLDSRKEPVSYLSSKAIGTVESTHVGGRTEVVQVVQVELTRYFHEENLWVLGGGTPNGGIIQPQGRKNYFIPVLSGFIDFEWKKGRAPIAQLIEASHRGEGIESDAEYWIEFRVANIVFEKEQPVSLLFKHYKYKDGEWTEIAGYEATFDGSGTRAPDDPVSKNKAFEHPLFTEHAKNCKRCGGRMIAEDGPVPICEEGLELIRQDAINRSGLKK